MASLSTSTSSSQTDTERAGTLKDHPELSRWLSAEDTRTALLANQQDRIDKVIIRWLKRHLHYLGDNQNWDHIHSLVEDHAMIAENIRKWPEQLREEGYQKAQAEVDQERQQRLEAEVEKQAAEKRLNQAVMKMLLKGLPAEDVAEFFDLSVEDVYAIKQQNQH